VCGDNVVLRNGNDSGSGFHTELLQVGCPLAFRGEIERRRRGGGGIGPCSLYVYSVPAEGGVEIVWQRGSQEGQECRKLCCHAADEQCEVIGPKRHLG